MLIKIFLGYSSDEQKNQLRKFYFLLSDKVTYTYLTKKKIMKRTPNNNKLTTKKIILGFTHCLSSLISMDAFCND